MTKTNESCSKIMNLELQDLNASTNVVAYNSGAATIRSHSALIPVNRLITNVTLIATYSDGITRSSGNVKRIGMYDNLKYIILIIIVRHTFYSKRNSIYTFELF